MTLSGSGMFAASGTAGGGLQSREPEGLIAAAVMRKRIAEKEEIDQAPAAFSRGRRHPFRDPLAGVSGSRRPVSLVEHRGKEPAQLRLWAGPLSQLGDQLPR